MDGYIYKSAALDTIMKCKHDFRDGCVWIPRHEIAKLLDELPSADELTIVTEYCRKRNLVIITMESFRVLQAYYNRQNGTDGE